MSIIQDALKKFSVNTDDANSVGTKKEPSPFRPQIQAPDSRSRHTKKTFGPSVILFLVLASLVYFAVKGFSPDYAGRSSEISYPAMLQTIYRPVSSADAGINNTSQPASVAKKKKTRFPDLVLSGIVQLVDGPRAIINDVMIGVGGIVNGATVTKIDKDSVSLEKKETQITLGME